MDNSDATIFINGIEEKLGSPVTWRTFSTWYGSNEGVIREYGVFLCICGGQLYGEDFERLPQILGYTLKQKNRPKYEKYSFSIPLSRIKSISRVTKKGADLACRAASKVPLAEAGAFSKAMSQIVTQLETEDGICHYFELISHKEFIDALRKELTDGSIQGL